MHQFLQIGAIFLIDKQIPIGQPDKMFRTGQAVLTERALQVGQGGRSRIDKVFQIDKAGHIDRVLLIDQGGRIGKVFQIDKAGHIDREISIGAVRN